MDKIEDILRPPNLSTIGKWKNAFERVGLTTKCFILLAIVQFFVLEALAIVNFVQYAGLSPEEFKGGPMEKHCYEWSGSNSKADCLIMYETNSFIAMISAFFMLFFALHGLFEANLAELAAFIASSTILSIPAVFILVSRQYTLDVYDMVLAICILVGEVGYLGLFLPVYNEYQWILFKKIGSDPQVIDIYTKLHRFKAAMKLNLLFSCVLLISSGVVSPRATVVDIVCTCVGAAFMLFIFQFFGYLAVNRESKTGMFTFMGLLLVAPAFIGFKIYLFYYSSYSYYKLQVAVFIVTGFLMILCQFIQFIFAILCYKNFGKGLLMKDQYSKKISVDSETAKLIQN